MPIESPRRVLMLGTFGLRPKATLRSRALAMAQALPSSDWTFRLITTPWDYPQDAGKCWVEGGVPVVNTNVTNPITFPFATTEMIRRSRHMQPELIHLFKPKGFGDIAARRLRRRTPVIVDMDDWEGDGGWNEIGGYIRIQRRIFDWQERTWPRQAAAVTVASRELEHRALALGAQPHRVHYIPNGLTGARFDLLSRRSSEASRIQQRLDLGDGPVILLYTRFIEFEPAMVVSVLIEVRKSFPTAMLLIVGASADGLAEITVRVAAQQAGLSEAIRWHGWADPAEIPDLAAASAVAIHPFDDNLVNRAKCSVKLLELMATGIPVVTTNVGENASFIQDGISGILAPLGEPTLIAQAVVRLLIDRAFGRELGRSAQQNVKTHYLWEQLAGRVADAYREVLDLQ
ncbi:MAG TPA: glycosyltransferase family 4 protein [Nitrolancea sp.]|nr:glycosyltransferase family 4 protein [Nitrolancea sp.]